MFRSCTVTSWLLCATGALLLCASLVLVPDNRALADGGTGGSDDNPPVFVCNFGACDSGCLEAQPPGCIGGGGEMCLQHTEPDYCIDCVCMEFVGVGGCYCLMPQ